MHRILDTEALDVKSSTVADDLYASENLKAESQSLLSDANGPNATFNGLLTSFATTQSEVSADEILILENKKTPVTSAQISALSNELGALFKQIVNLQNKLSK